MRRKQVFFEGSQAFRQAFDQKPKLLAAFGLPLPAIVRNDGPIDLNANRQIARDHLGGETLGIGPFCHGRPRDEHA